ncbi:tRNA pseudouridine(55) synthase TruB [bacterium]|nr:tRNA pseudouridine(55) synthase TruB [bacterium]
MDGILIINKPSGPSSAKIVSEVKKILGAKKVGHAGTLDPLASGVLVLCINKATKLASKFLIDDKEYRVTMKLGESTDTYDSEGKVSKIREVDPGIVCRIQGVLAKYLGEIEQMPPKYSALKINGTPAYKLAREGKEVKLKPRRVIIHDIHLEFIDIPLMTLKVSCSKGTYIRSLVYDIGEDLGCGAHVTGLVRLKSGRFFIENALEMDKVRSQGFKASCLNYLIN